MDAGAAESFHIILDLSAWDMTHQGLADLVGALARRVPGSPYDCNVVTLVVGPTATIEALQEALRDHKTPFEMIYFDNNIRLNLFDLYFIYEY